MCVIILCFEMALTLVLMSRSERIEFYKKKLFILHELKTNLKTCRFLKFELIFNYNCWADKLG